MPVIRIEVPEGTERDIKKRIRESVKQAVLDTLAPKETITAAGHLYPRGSRLINRLSNSRVTF